MADDKNLFTQEVGKKFYDGLGAAVKNQVINDAEKEAAKSAFTSAVGKAFYGFLGRAVKAKVLDDAQRAGAKEAVTGAVGKAFYGSLAQAAGAKVLNDAQEQSAKKSIVDQIRGETGKGYLEIVKNALKSSALVRGAMGVRNLLSKSREIGIQKGEGSLSLSPKPVTR